VLERGIADAAVTRRKSAPRRYARHIMVKLT
jgi:hypothetical protein